VFSATPVAVPLADVLDVPDVDVPDVDVPDVDEPVTVVLGTVAVEPDGAFDPVVFDELDRVEPDVRLGAAVAPGMESERGWVRKERRTTMPTAVALRTSGARRIRR